MSTKKATRNSSYSADELRNLRGAKSSKNETTSKRLWTNEYMAEYAQKRNEQEESYNRGVDILNAQRQRDADEIQKRAAGDFARQTVEDLIMPKRVSPSSAGVSASQAYRNQQTQEQRADEVQQILGNNTLTEEGRRQQLASALSGAVSPSAPSAPERYSYQGLLDYASGLNAGEVRANSAARNAMRSDAEKKERARKAEEAKQNANPAVQAAYQYQERSAQGRIDAEKKELEALRQEKNRLNNYRKAYSRATVVQNNYMPTAEEIDRRTKEIDEKIAAKTKEIESGQYALDEQIRNRKLQNYDAVLYADDFKANSSFNGSDSYEAKRVNGWKPAEYDPLMEFLDDYYAQIGKDERQIYNYLLNTKGQGAASEYLALLKPTLDMRATNASQQKMAEIGKTAPIFSTAASIILSPIRGAGALGTLLDKTLNDTVNPYAIYNRPSAMISGQRSGMDERLREDVSNAVKAMGGGETAQKLVSGGASLVNSGIVAGLESAWNGLLAQNMVGNFGMGFKDAQEIATAVKALPEAQKTAELIELGEKAQKVVDAATQLTTIVMGAGAVSDSVRVAKERGLSDDQAFELGLIAGITEYATEHISVENLFNTDWTPQNLRQTILKGLQQGGFEASEEVVGDIVNGIADLMVSGDKNEWKTAVDAYRKDGLSDGKAFAKVLGEKIWDTAKSGISGFISAGGPVVSEVAKAGVYNAKFKTHNDVQKSDRKNSTTVGSDIDAILKAAIGKPEAEWTDDLADVANALKSVYHGSTINRAKDYIRETAKRSVSTVDQLAYGRLADYLGENKQAVWDLAQQIYNGDNIEVEDRRDAEPSTASSTETSAPSTESSTASGESTTPQIQATTAENQAITTENQATTQQTAQNAPQAAPEAADETDAVRAETPADTESGTENPYSDFNPLGPSSGIEIKENLIGARGLKRRKAQRVAEQIRQAQARAESSQSSGSAVQTSGAPSVTAQTAEQERETAPSVGNAAEENAAQNGSATAENGGRSALLRALNVSEEATDAEIARSLLNGVDRRKFGNRFAGLKNTAASDMSDTLNEMRRSGQYTPEQIEAARQTAVAVDRELLNLTSEAGVQKLVTAANEGFRRAGIQAKIVVDNVAARDYRGDVVARGSYKDSDGTIHVSPYLDTNEAIYGVIAHEMFHKAADGSERARLVDDILAARSAILDASESRRYGVSRATRSVIGNASMGDFVESYGDLLMKDFGLTEEGQTALKAKLGANPGMDGATALKQLCNENEEAFWKMFKDSDSLGTAQEYMKEEVAAHFFEELGSRNGEALMRELVRNDRNLFERIIDAIRRYFHRNDPDYARNETYNRIMNAYERIAAEESGLDARKLKGTAAQKAEIAESTLMTDGNGNPVMQYSLDSLMEPLHLTFQKDENGVTQLLDSDNNPIKELTAQDVMDSDYGVIIQNNVKDGIITKEEGRKEAQFLADTVNLMLKTQDVDMIWAVNSTIGFQPIQPGTRDEGTFDAKKGDKDEVQSKFAGFTANSDPQYSTTIDFTTICKKTQQVIDTMSKIMKEKTSGLTQDEIINIVYDEVAKAGEPVPCPVCYVFARWVGLGGLFDNMYQWQEVDYPRTMDTSKIRDDIARLGRQIEGLINQKLTEQQKQEALDEEVTDEEAEAEPDKKTPFGKMKNKLAKELAKERKLLEIKQMKHDIQGTEALTEEEQAEFDRLTEQINYLDRWTWLTNVRLRDDYNETGYVPSDILFDINAGKVFAEKYAPAWAYRTSRGPSMGKAATPYAAEHLGQIITGIAKPSTVSGHTLGNLNKDVFLGTNGQSNQDVEDTLKAARENAKKQNLLNGQRLQSTSDFRYEYALDYLMALFELQAVGAKAQMYTKVPEMVAMAASCGVEINLSLMPLGDGYVIENGKKKLAFSDVTGMFWEDAKLLSSMYDNVQPIMVGINHDHIRLCMREDWITFIIPYHSSGGSEGRYVAMMKAVGEEVTNRTDYSDYQKDFKIKDATPEQIAAREARKLIVTGKASEMTDEQKNAVRNNAILSQLHIRFYGTDVDGNEARVDDKYLNAKDKGTGRDSDTFGVFLSTAQAETVMPYEFWDKTVTLQNAQQNGKLFTEYCEALGLHPRFSGWDKNGKYHKEYDFTDEAGYWKVLPDRSMYNHVVGTSQYGTYHEQKPVNISHLQEDYLASDRSETDSNVEGDTPGMKAARAYLGGRIRNENGEFVRDNDPNIKKPSADNDPTKTADIAAKSIARIEAERAKQNRSYKEQQFDLLNSSFTEDDEPYIRFDSPDDILTFGEAVEANGGADQDVSPEFTSKAVKTALETGKVKVFLTQPTFKGVPIEAGVPVFTSKADAKAVAGNGKTPQRTFALQDIAWKNASEGLYTPLGVKPPSAPKDIDTGITDAVRETTDTSRQSRLVTPEEDAEYMEAVESGDTEKQRRMVDDAAKAAGYTEAWAHGSPNAMFTSFDLSKARGAKAVFLSDRTTASSYANTSSIPMELNSIGKTIDNVDDALSEIKRIKGGMFTPKKVGDVYKLGRHEYTEQELLDYANETREKNHGGVYGLYVNPGKQLVVDAKGRGWNEIRSDYGSSTDKIGIWAKSHGYDSVLIEDVYDSKYYNGMSQDVLLVFDGNRLKSTNLVTYDDDGNVIPLSERFNLENNDIRYSRMVTPEMDEEYMDAVESGDKETQNRIIEEAAKAAFPNSVLIQNGKFRKMWHHTNKEFTSFLPGTSASSGGLKGIYFTPQENSTMSNLGNRHGAYYLNVENLKFAFGVEADKQYRDELKKLQEGVTDREELAKINREFSERTGIDAFFDWQNGWYNVLRPELIKSADPITYDNDGNVIPPSRRFTDSEDIRESRMLKSELDLELARAQDNLDLMKAQLRDNMASDVAKAIKATDLDEMVQRYSDMFGDYISKQTVREYLRPVWKAMQRTRASGETAVDRLETVWREAETAARKMLEDTSYETTLKDAIGDEATLNGLKALYNRLNVRRNGNDAGYYYIIPEMHTAAGGKEAFDNVRRDLNGVKLQGFRNAAEAQASGRKPVSELFTDLISNGEAYNDLFTPDETASDFDKLSQIATAYALAKEAEADPYQRRYYGNEENTAAVYNLANDITYALESRAEPTKMAKVKAQFDERYAKMQSDYEERMRKQAEKATEKYDKLLEKTKGRDIKRAQRMVLGRIAKDISMLDKLQNHPSKDKNKYIPQRLLGTVAKVREAVQNFANRSGKTIDPARLAELQQSAMDETQNFMEGLGQGLNGVGSATKANTRQDPNITDVFIRQADNLIQQLRDLRADIEENHPARPTVDENGKRITPTSEMIAEDNTREEAMYEYFNTVRQLLDMTLQAIRNEGKMILNGRTQDLREVSQLLASDLKQHRQKDVSLRHRNLGDETENWFQMGTFGLMSADAALQRLGDNWHSFIARSVREGQNRQMKHQADFSDFMRETIGNYDITKGGFYGDYVELERPTGKLDKNGKPITEKFNVTRHELMSLYALWNRPAGRLHLENGGGTFINQNGQAFHDNNVVLTDELVKEYTDHLTDQEKEIVDKVVDYMSHEASKWGNDVSMYVYGYRLFNEDTYFPMEVADYANKRSFTDPTMPGSGLNPGFTQALTRSKKPLAIRDFFDVVNDHIIGMANYNAYGAAAHDLDRILNSSLKDGDKETSMIELLRKTYGNGAVAYLKEFVQKLAGTKQEANSWLNNWRTIGYLAGNLYKRAAVSWNLSTAAKQPLSIIRAANEIDPKYLIFRKPMSPAEYKAAKEKMESLSGIAKIKSLGYSDTGHAKSLQATYDDKYFSDSNFLRRGLGSNKAARGAFRFSDKFTEAGMYLAGKADEMTWVNIWDAVTHEVMDKYPNLSGDELDAKITERFNEVIGLTQVVDSVLDSAPILQEKIFSIAFPFMNEPVKSASNLILAASKVKQPGGMKKFLKAAGLQMLSAVLLEPLVSTLASMWRDEKDDIRNGFWDHFFEKMFGIKKDEDDDGKSDTDWKSITTSNAFAGIWSMPFITQLYDVYSNALQDYDNTSIDRAAVVDLVKAFQNLHKYNGASNEKSAKTQNRLWREFAESFASVLGVPAKTIRRQISGTARMIMNATDADELKWEYNKLSYNLENSNARSQKGFYDILAHAYATGDMETYEKFRKELNDIVTDNSTLVDVNTIIKNIEKRGGKVQPGDPLWNVEVQARFRLDTPVKGWHNENFLTGVYKQAEAAGIKDDECKKVLYSLPDKYEYEDEEGDDIEMSPAEYDQFASDCGDLAYKLVSQLSSSSNAKAWSALTIDQQLYAIEKVYDYSKRKCRKDINPDLDISGMGKDLVAVYETAPMDTSKIVSTVMAMAKKYDKKKERKKK